ncbi:SLC13 family permease [Streptacidiphilus melanogenes]|uniref:SLC13 family permease n=1 Tax=Streptacidiphilus melanogenes TaxID=411235 RepID=UPI0005A5FC36|nr:SLC13 family permease [Streptacidiphilus melanogenes]
MSTPVAETVSILLLAVVLVCAVVRPFGWPEAVAAVPAAGLLVAFGAVTPAHALSEASRLGPVIGFLAAVLVLAQLCADEGLFEACGAWMARSAAGRPRRLFVQVFAFASVTTAVLSLDATVVLLTPVVFATTARLEARPKPHVYACAHLSNSASLLLPVSNLTNLLAFTAAGLSFTRFTALMALPWLVAIAVEYAVLRRFFAADLDAGAAATDPGPARELPLFALVTVACTLAGFVLTSVLGVNPVWAAAAGAAVMAVRALVRRHTTPRAIVRSAALPFLAFVLGLGIVVQAVVDNGMSAALAHLVPGGTSLPALLGIAALAALLANVINNLPATLVLVPLTAPTGPGAVLAVLLGVNIGPNLTYAGSLATLLWRRIMGEHDTEVELGEFTRLGLLTVPLALVATVLALWGGLQTIGV